MDRTRGQLLSSSSNSSRKLFIHSNASFIDYAERVQAQANIPMQTKQIDNESSQSLSLLCATVKEEENSSMNMAPKNKPIHVPYVSETVNMCLP